MAAYRSHIVFEMLRGIRAFLNFEVGVTRGKVPNLRQNQDQTRKFRQAQKKTAEKNQSLTKARQREANKDQEIARSRKAFVSADKADAAGHNIKPENIIWIFGNGRSGNTWLSSMMRDLNEHAVWPEPCVGELFGNFYYDQAREKQRKGKSFILTDREREGWLKGLRSFVLEIVNSRFQDAEKRYLVVKEQRGSIGSPLLMEALPESRMILLVRDPRDVVASNVDAVGEEGWAHWVVERGGKKSTDLEGQTRIMAQRYLRNVSSAKQAYEAHQGPKVLVKYEELREDPLFTMQRLYDSLNIPVDEGELARVVEKHSWENIPAEKKGEGKFYRKATPGSWQEDLSARQTQIVEEITKPILDVFYKS